MKLLGAREFIKMPVGTLYMRYWKDTIEECVQVFNKFRENPKKFLNIQPDDLCVFGDNSASMMFYGEKEENYIFYYDANVVGDASPATTLYLVIDEGELPNEILIHDEENNIVKLSKNDVIKIKNMFVNEVYKESKTGTWVFEYLDELAAIGNKVIDVKIELK